MIEYIALMTIGIGWIGMFGIGCLYNLRRDK